MLTARSLAFGSRGARFALLHVHIRTTVARVRAELRAAEIDLVECTVYAPADGYVTHFFLKPGAVATNLPLSPVMTFVYSGEPIVFATFSANVQRNIKVDDPAEITLDTNPGATLKAKVLDIVPASGEGALSPTGTLLRTTEKPAKGRVIVLFRFTENISSMRIPAGTSGARAIIRRPRSATGYRWRSG